MKQHLIGKGLCGVLGMVALSACNLPGGTGQAEPLENVGQTTQAISPGSGYGVYCSVTFPNGTWGLPAPTNQNTDPCAGIAGDTVHRKGFWSLAGWNFVIARCDQGFALRHGFGGAPINDAANWANNLTNCIFTITPRELPVFDSPFNGTPSQLDWTNGFDHSVNPPATVNTQTMGTDTVTNSSIMDFLGLSHQPLGTLSSTGFGIDNHQGHDWAINPNTTDQIKAVADGTVILVRRRALEACRCGGGFLNASQPDQLETYIRHDVFSPTANVTERFVSYYGHLSSFASGFGEGTTNKAITAGTVIGNAGSSGCSTNKHLHFGVFRLSNTANTLFLPLSSPPTEAELAAMTPIDPYGWSVTCQNTNDCIDPWAYARFPVGASSINLWKTAPPRP
jgi:hypothetical protein